MTRRGAVVVAAGRSERMGFDKVWATLCGRPVLAYAIEMLAAARLEDLVLVVSAPRLEPAKVLLASLRVEGRVCAGGERRRDSVANGVARLADCDWIVVHDAARPLASANLVLRGLDAARATGAAVPGIPIHDTVKRIKDGEVVETLPRDDLRRVQTPQVFARDLLVSALSSTQEDVGDEATLVERVGGQVRVFPGEEANIKLTVPDDLRLAAALLQARQGEQPRSAPKAGT